MLADALEAARDGLCRRVRLRAMLADDGGYCLGHDGFRLPVISGKAKPMPSRPIRVARRTDPNKRITRCCSNNGTPYSFVNSIA